MKVRILVNSLGIQDSGGITVLDKFLSEMVPNFYRLLIVCNKNENIDRLITKYRCSREIEFLVICSKNVCYRLYFENIVFKKLIKMEKIDLIYNFSGTAQYFCKIPQLIKVHNLLFYSKKIDQIYFQKKQYISWVKQIFLRRIVLHSMVRNIHYVEIQSNHVRVYMNDFINISKKKFFIKSDIALLKELFSKPKRYDFSKKIRFLYIVGPHFEYLHKNFEDFIMVMKKLSKEGFNFEIVITLTKDQLSNSTIWDKRLDKRTMFLGYMSKEELKKQFQDNTILISTSVIETLGLHVIEAIQNGILTIVPNEKYSSDVYGKNILEYNLFNSESLVKTVKRIALLKGNNIRDMISKNQQYLIENENKKDQSITDAFDHIIKVKNV